MPAKKVANASAGKKLGAEIHQGKPVLILFHANWCPHCVDYIGHPPAASYPWGQVCKQIDATFGDKVGVYEVESEQMKHLPAGMPQVQGFPTLMFHDGDNFHEFSGDRRDPKAVVAFIQQNGGAKSGGTKSGSAKKKTGGDKKKTDGGAASGGAKSGGAKKKTTKK